MRMYKVGGDIRYLHLEAQGQFEDDIDHRVWDHNKGLTIHLGEEAVSILVLVDDVPDFRPGRYHYEEWRCKKTFEYPVVKLLDFRDKQEALKKSPNTFALFVLGHLWSQETAKDVQRRLDLKLQLLSLLIEKKLDEVEFGSWHRLFDWQLQLPPESEARVMDWLKEKRREGVMPFVSNFEKLVRQEARDEGLKEGEQKGLQRGARTALKARFGPSGASLGPRLAKAGVAALEAVLTAIEAGRPLEEIEALLPPA